MDANKHGFSQMRNVWTAAVYRLKRNPDAKVLGNSRRTRKIQTSHRTVMQKVILDNRRWVSVAILVVSLPIYACLSWPAIRQRGFPEIDPFWNVIPWLWIVPIILSGMFNHDPRSRKWDIIVYTLVASFFYSGTCFMVVPHHETLNGMLFKLLFFGPINLLIVFAIEKVSQWLFRLLHLRNNDGSITRRGMFVAVGIFTLAVAFPFTCRAIAFQDARASGRADAERDWAHGNAIWYMRWSEPAMFGASGNGCYSLTNGLKTETMRPGVTSNVYFEAYRAVIERKLAQFGPPNTVKDLFSEADLQALIRAGRFKRVESFPLKIGTTEISPKGYQIATGQVSFSADPSKFVYCAIIPEKKNASVVINDDSIWIFTKDGQLLQSIDSNSYQQLGITENILRAGH
jgi:hypothetical protein